jgi:hypothetical protein
MTRAPPYQGVSLGPAKREKYVLRVVVDVRHQIERQGRAVTRIPVEEL